MTGAPEVGGRPAFYASRRGGLHQWWTVLHPPYTAWHLSYVVVGAVLAPHVDVTILVGTVVAFFLAVGVAAHALDELCGRPLRTTLPAPALATAVGVGLIGAVAIGADGIARVGWVLVPFLVLGPLLVVAYNAELFGGVVHTDVGFALAWGAFPVLTAYVAQSRAVTLPAILAALAAAGLSMAQRRLSTPARQLRRHTSAVEGHVLLADGRTREVDRAYLLAPLEGALRSLSWAVVVLATALATARLT